jgi:hypothetical protein
MPTIITPKYWKDSPRQNLLYSTPFYILLILKFFFVFFYFFFFIIILFGATSSLISSVRFTWTRMESKILKRWKQVVGPTDISSCHIYIEQCVRWLKEREKERERERWMSLQSSLKLDMIPAGCCRLGTQRCMG